MHAISIYAVYTTDRRLRRKSLKDIPEHGKNIMLVNFKLHRNVVKVLDRLVESGLYKTRVDVMLSALRVYKPFQETWKKEALERKEEVTSSVSRKRLVVEAVQKETSFL
jgi:Arc/MetJ-type ribon-helix-helix transcriptional regulator